MKAFFQAVPNKLKGVYIVWLFVHICFLTYGLLHDPPSLRWKVEIFYPFQWGFDRITRESFLNPDLKYYDYTEFIVYAFAPVVLAYAIWLFKKK